MEIFVDNVKMMGRETTPSKKSTNKIYVKTQINLDVFKTFHVEKFLIKFETINGHYLFNFFGGSICAKIAIFL
jgi:hypothetical protein